MKCEFEKTHDQLSFATLKHLTGILDEALQQAGIDSAAKRESICGHFIFRSSYFFDNQWVAFNKRRYRIGLCFQEFATDAFSPEKALVTDYKNGEILHETAHGISEEHFRKGSVVTSFEEVGEAYTFKP